MITYASVFITFSFFDQNRLAKMRDDCRGKFAWWRHQMEAFSTLLALSDGNPLVTGEFPSQRPVMQSFDVFYDLRLNKRLSKQSWGWWFEMPLHSLRHHCNNPFYPSTCSSLCAKEFSVMLFLFQLNKIVCMKHVPCCTCMPPSCQKNNLIRDLMPKKLRLIKAWHPIQI